MTTSSSTSGGIVTTTSQNGCQTITTKVCANGVAGSQTTETGPNGTTTSGPAPVCTTTHAPVPLVPVSGVAGVQHTSTSTPAVRPVGVKGAQHTVKTPVVQSAAAPLAAAKKTGTLPFTGIQLTLFLLVGLGLVATGLVLRATGRRSSSGS